ncbi:MAG TPA: cytochrome P450 [Solirubrobacterales bacterium]|nr:cytochrome P450 [Solirubrobacterales bacterium]
MPALAELDLPFLDWTDEAFKGDEFHERMETLAAEDWLAGSEPGWIFVLDREAASHFLRSKAVVFPSAVVAQAFGINDGPLADAIRKNIISIEGADHGRLRNLVNPSFTPRAADRWREVAREHLAEIFAPLEGGGEHEFVGTVAKRYPSMTIASVVGAPVEDAPRLHNWATWFQRQFDPAAIMAHRDEIEAAIVEFTEYATALIEAKRDDPGEDLISTLLTATHEGDRLSDDECLNLIMNVLAGGVDTTQAQLAHGIRLFARYPEQWERIRSDPQLIPRAVEELLRFEPITPFTARMTTEEVVFREVAFPANTVLMISTFVGNRDTETYDEPFTFDVTADRGKAKPMTFGAGIHNCLGASLARAELQEALTYLAPRMPNLELTGDPVYESVAGVYGLEELPIRFG